MAELFGLWQRLVEDEVCGLNYDYMGYAEYEFGATLTARRQLAEWLDKCSLTSWKAEVLLHDRGLRYKKTVLLFSHVDVIRRLAAETSLSVASTKGSLDVDNRSIVGWITVHTDTPIIMMPINPDFTDDERPQCTNSVHKYLSSLERK